MELIFVLVLMIIILIIILIIMIINYYNYKNKIDEIYVINLEKRKDRLEFIKKTYNLEKDFITYKAIDGKTLDLNKLQINGIIDKKTSEQLEKKRNHHYELTHEGSIGCYLSHYYLWKSLQESNKSQILIFEDDVIFNKITLREINKRLLLLPKNWDIYLLNNETTAYDKSYYNKKTHKHLFKVNRFFGMYAYVINKQAVNKIINSNTLFPIHQQIDSYLGELAIDFNLNIYIHNNRYNYYNHSSIFGTDIQIYDTSPLTYKRNLLIRIDG